MLSVDKILPVNSALFCSVSLYELYAESFAVIDESFDPFRECPCVRPIEDLRYRSYDAKSANGPSVSSETGEILSAGCIGNSGDFSPGPIGGPFSSSLLAFSRSI